MKTLSIANDIIPTGEFKTKIAKWFKSIQETGQPLIITQNGRPAGVLLSPQEYDELIYRRSFLLSVDRGIDDAEKGRLFTTEEAISNLFEPVTNETQYMKIMWTNEALTRLRDIKTYNAHNNPDRARLRIQKIIDRTDIIISNPQIGRVVPEISRPDIRELLFHNYRIVYRVKRDYIEILTVFEGHRLLNNSELND